MDTMGLVLRETRLSNILLSLPDSPEGSYDGDDAVISRRIGALPERAPDSIGMTLRNSPGLPRTARDVSVHAQAGFTLLELVTVTVIMGILALIVAQSYRQIRQKAMLAATKTDVRNAMEAIDRYKTVNGDLPATITDLAAVGWRHSPDVNFCTFTLQQAQAPYVLMEAAYRGADTMIESHYPVWGVRMDEKPNNRQCTGTTSGSKGRSNGRGRGRGGNKGGKNNGGSRGRSGHAGRRGG